jgi:hypothetical protein
VSCGCKDTVVVRGKVFCEVVAYAASATASDEDVFLRWGHDDGRDQQSGHIRLRVLLSRS